MLIDAPQRKESTIKSALKQNKKIFAITRPPWWVTNTMNTVKAPQAFLHLFNCNPEFLKLVLLQTLLWRISY